ncbi:MAG: nickel-responsive transcriptional regulator NikR [Candidatus Marinimicrobia bacterium]|nr:nickel-responsive transcriptional regulator NikR [Candidatus Neomarinimicrobiota bacterium]MCF7851355.1 nickel-responsive transcriptional regulator NikR [Candidatus Neomarinimicrobiota bacterium]MCF7905167.1 nickel-responsive transcriptional regulator NikR [Candidatus Neomarinimicrobiota bacterium]
MNTLQRFGVSVDGDLLAKFDEFIADRNYKNRSEALRDLMRDALVKEQWTEDEIIAGAIAFVYDHHKGKLVNKLMELQHHHHHIIISSQHIHLDHDNCMEIIMAKGAAKEIGQLHDSIRSMKGVKHVDLLRSTTGKEF